MFQGLRSRETRIGRQPPNNSESGQALLELALVVPILVLLIMAIFQ
jgi:TadE-like protein.